MEKRNKLKIGCGIFLAICVIFFLVSINKDLGEAFKAQEYSTVIEFKGVNQVIYITSRRWGLGGQHFHLVISNIFHAGNDILINKKRDIVLDNRCGLYYKKQEPDSLFIFLPSNSYTEEESYNQIGNVNIKIMEVKKMTYNNLKNNYKTLGLTPIICFDN